MISSGSESSISPCSSLAYFLNKVLSLPDVASVPPPPPPEQSTSTETTPAPTLPGNLKNDGSFLEQFKKMQQQQAQSSNATGEICCLIQVIISGLWANI